MLLEHEKPVPDPTSGLFCAFNAGTTIVTITRRRPVLVAAVTVQAGSVRRPCGTARWAELPAQQGVGTRARAGAGAGAGPARTRVGTAAARSRAASAGRRPPPAPPCTCAPRRAFSSYRRRSVAAARVRPAAGADPGAADATKRHLGRHLASRGRRKGRGAGGSDRAGQQPGRRLPRPTNTSLAGLRARHRAARGARRRLAAPPAPPRPP